MCRGESPFLQCSKNIYKESILEVFSFIRKNKISNKEIQNTPILAFSIAEIFATSLEDSLATSNLRILQSPSDLLVEKILLGMFATAPTLDQCVKSALVALRGISEIKDKFDLSLLPSSTSTLDEEYFRKWFNVYKIIEYDENLKKLNSKFRSFKFYPIARKTDLVLWLKSIQ